MLFKKLLLRYKIGFSPLCFNGSFAPLCFNGSFDHHRFFFPKCDIIKDSVACYVVGIALFSYEKLTNLDQLAPRTN